MTFDDTLATLQESLVLNKVPAETIQRILRDLRKAKEDEKSDKPAKTKLKTQHVILSTTAGLGYVLQLDEAAPPQVAIDRIKAAANAHNDSRRGRKHPIKTVGEAMEGLKAKWLKSAVPSERTTIKTRTAVAVLTVDNDLSK